MCATTLEIVFLSFGFFFPSSFSFLFWGALLFFQRSVGWSFLKTKCLSLSATILEGPGNSLLWICGKGLLLVFPRQGSWSLFLCFFPMLDLSKTLVRPGSSFLIHLNHISRVDPWRQRVELITSLLSSHSRRSPSRSILASTHRVELADAPVMSSHSMRLSHS